MATLNVSGNIFISIKIDISKPTPTLTSTSTSTSAPVLDPHYKETTTEQFYVYNSDHPRNQEANTGAATFKPSDSAFL